MRYKAENGEHCAFVIKPDGTNLVSVPTMYRAEDIANELNSLLDTIIHYKEEYELNRDVLNGMVAKKNELERQAEAYRQETHRWSAAYKELDEKYKKYKMVPIRERFGKNPLYEYIGKNTVVDQSVIDSIKEEVSSKTDSKRMNLVREGWYICKSTAGFYLYHTGKSKEYLGKTIDEAFDAAILAGEVK